MKRVLAALRSPVVRAAFLLLVLGIAIWALVTQWDTFVRAITTMSPWPVIGALAFSLAHVFVMMLAWRLVLIGLGTRITYSDTTVMYGVGQLGKYLPGGVWNILAVAELGADRQVPRRTSAASAATATMISVLTALTLGSLTFAFAPSELLRSFGWLGWLILPLAVCLLPPVFNRLLGFAFRVTRMGEAPRMQPGPLALAIGLSLVGWTLAGLQLWLVATELGLPSTPASVVTTVSAGSLAWAAGLLFLPAPAGVGVREAVVGVALAAALSGGAVAALLLLTRVMSVLADLGFAIAGLVVGRLQARRGARTTPTGTAPADLTEQDN